MANADGRGPEHDVCSCGFSLLPVPPRLVLGYQQDLQSLIEELTAMRAVDARVVLDSAIDELDERQEALQKFELGGMDLAPTVRYGPTSRVLRDLVSQGWTIRGDDESVILDAPGRAAVRLDDPEAAKESIRRSFLRLTDLARKRHG